MVCGGHRQKAADYVLENWGAARKRLWKRYGVLDCSAEEHVYHVLSSRMSSLAMGWSRHGASQMARLREYYHNGGDMLELARYQKAVITKAAGAEELELSAKAVLSSPSTSMRIFNRHGQGINLWENRVVFSRFFCYTLSVQKRHFGIKN